MSSLAYFYCDPFDRLFDDAFNVRFRVRPSAPSVQVARPARTPQSDSFRPRLDVHESKESNTVTVTFELPGLQSENVTIDVQENRLTVSGDSGAPSASEEGTFAIQERRRGKLSRTLQLPVGTKIEDVKAKMENGLLTVTFPKTTPEQEPQRIAINQRDNEAQSTWTWL